MTQTLYEFGEFEIDCARFELRRNGPIVKLEHIPMELHITTALVSSRTWPTMALVVSPCASAFNATRHATVSIKQAKCTARAMNTPLICLNAEMYPQ